MKKYLPIILCTVILLSLLLNVYTYANEQSESLEPLWIETFDGSDSATKYVSTSKYNASVANGVLTLKATNDSHRDTYRLSGDDDALSKKTKLTFAFTFKPDSLHKQGSIFASFGHSENKAYIAGVQRLTGNSCLVYGTAVEGATKGTLTTTQRYIMQPFSDGSPSSANVEFPADGVITMIIEVDNNSSTVCSMYVDGVRVGVAGEVKGNNYDASSDSTKTMDGHFGMCVPTSSTAIKVGAYAIYDGTGLDHDDIMQQVYNESEFASKDDGGTKAPSTNNTNPNTGITNTPSDTTEKSSDSDTDKTTESIAEDTQDTQNGGCSSSMSIAAITVVGAVGCVGIVFKKKERK